MRHMPPTSANGKMTMISFFFQAEDGIRDGRVTGVQTCALPISTRGRKRESDRAIPKPDKVATTTEIAKAIEYEAYSSVAIAFATRIWKATPNTRLRSEERRVGKGVELGGGRSSKRKKKRYRDDG